MSKRAILQRLQALASRPGRPTRGEQRIRLSDVAAWLGMTPRNLDMYRSGEQQLDDRLQTRLSLLFMLMDRDLIVKVGRGVLERRALPAGAREPPRATIDVSGPAPRVKWS